MSLTAIYAVNGSAIGLLVILFLSINKTYRKNLPDEKLFFLMLLMTILQAFMESVSFYIDGKIFNGGITANYLVNSFLFINNIVFSFTWTIYADYKLFQDSPKRKKLHRFTVIPALIVIALVFINFFRPVLFSIDAYNVYHRGSLFFIAYAFTYFYLIWGVSTIYHYKDTLAKYMFMPAIMFMIPIFFASVLQFIFYGVSLTWMGVAIALVSLYINIQNEISYVDSLSGLFTRQYMYYGLDSIVSKLDSSKRLVGIMLDIDDFKDINDTYGHQVGDSAIQEAGAIILKSLRPKDLGIRYAGDEFIILLIVQYDEEITFVTNLLDLNIAKSNDAKTHPYTLSFSKGLSEFDCETDTVDTFLNRIDQMMYKNKKHTKECIQKES